MKNTLIDLNNHLFVEIERLNDEEIKGEELAEELERAKAIAGISSQIVQNAKLALDVEKFKYDVMGQKASVPKMMEG